MWGGGRGCGKQHLHDSAKHLLPGSVFEISQLQHWFCSIALFFYCFIRSLSKEYEIITNFSDTALGDEVTPTHSFIKFRHLRSTKTTKCSDTCTHPFWLVCSSLCIIIPNFVSLTGWELCICTSKTVITFYLFSLEARMPATQWNSYLFTGHLAHPRPCLGSEDSQE